MNQQEIIEQLKRELHQANEENAQLKLELETQQNYIYTLIDAIPDLIFAKDTEARVILANKAVCDTAKASREEMLGTAPHDVYPEDLADVFLEKDLAVIRSGETDRNEEWITTLEGGRELIDTIKVPFKNPDGTIGGLVGISRNITQRYHLEEELKQLNQTLEQQVAERTQALQAEIIDRKQAEDVIREGRRMLKDILDNIPSFVFWKDADLVYQGCNILFARAAGFEDTSEIIGKTDFDLPWKDSEAEAYRADDRQVIESGQPKLNILETQLQADGTQRWLRTSKIPLYDDIDPGNVRGVLGIFDDISEFKQAEIERERLQQAIIEAQKQAIQELSVPIIPVTEGIIVMPLIGSIDTLRAKDLMRTLLAGISQHRAKVVILDITGVPIVDTGVVAHLDKTIQAARLKGTRTIVTGISDAVAETLVDLGIDWSRVETLRDLQTGLVVALDSLGYQLT